MYSLNEAAAMAKKAARGAGYSWGLSEEAGAATRWLSSYGFDGCAALVTLLDYMDRSDPEKHGPVRSGQTWTSAKGSLCPLFAGATFADFARSHGSDGIVLKQVVAPLMFAPFAGDVATRTGRKISVDWSGGNIVTSGLEVSGDAMETFVTDIRISFDAELGSSRKTKTRASPSSSVWARLSEFAERTYAPATEASRLKGAGAGLSDND